MAGLGFKDFQVGEVLTSSDVDGYLMQQSVMRFADAGARGSALGTATGTGVPLAEGMVSYLDDENSLQFYNGTEWSAVAGFNAIEVITATDASWSVPALGNPIVRVTAIGGGGGANGGGIPGGTNGGNTTFGAYGTATGGSVGSQNDSAPQSGGVGLKSNNNGMSNYSDGVGGEVKTFYVDLSGVSTVNVTIGAGGTGANGGSSGGRGEVRVEYRTA